MDDLDRLFGQLVTVLAEATPSRLRSSFEVAELYQRILPYRRYKLALQLDSIEDYEMAILRLLAGERGYATVHPADVQDVLRAEIQTVNPSPAAFREYAAATVTLDRVSVGRFLDEETDYAPPGMRSTPSTADEPAPTPEPPTVPERPTETPADHPASDVPATTAEPPPAPVTQPGLVFEAVSASRRCPHCRGELPSDRRAVYCPHCGHQLDTRTCGRCGEPIERDWKFCLACGFALGS
ncbi:MAG: zinc ribbon domain-containing protein [Gemmatimonadales bacterium]|jgi:hypothetical protein